MYEAVAAERWRELQQMSLDIPHVEEIPKGGAGPKDGHTPLVDADPTDEVLTEPEPTGRGGDRGSRRSDSPSNR